MTVIGINRQSLNPLARGERFVDRYNLTFTNLWDDSDDVHSHYGSPYHSNYWLLDKNGDRVGNRAEGFSVSGAEQKLDELEQGG